MKKTGDWPQREGGNEKKKKPEPYIWWCFSMWSFMDFYILSSLTSVPWYTVCFTVYYSDSPKGPRQGPSFSGFPISDLSGPLLCPFLWIDYGSALTKVQAGWLVIPRGPSVSSYLTLGSWGHSTTFDLSLMWIPGELGPLFSRPPLHWLSCQGSLGLLVLNMSLIL